MPVSHIGDAGSTPARGAHDTRPWCQVGSTRRCQRCGPGSIPGGRSCGALMAMSGGLQPPERGSIPRSSTRLGLAQIENPPSGFSIAQIPEGVGFRRRNCLQPRRAPDAHGRKRSRLPLDTFLLSDAPGLRGPAVSWVRRVRLPSRALTRRSSADPSATLRGWGTEVRILPARSRHDNDASIHPQLRRRKLSEAAAFRDAAPPKAGIRAQDSARRNRAREQTPTTGRLGRRRSDEAVERGSIPRSSISP